jgi:RNA-directed DNA polymerase
LQSVRNYLADKLKLIVNETKSKVVTFPEACFLGFQIIRRKVRWTKKSQKKFKAKVKQITKRTRGHSPPSVIAELNRYVRGAFNYYQLGIGFGEARELDSWLRSRVRLYYWKQWGRPRTRRRKLLKMGIGQDEVKLASRSRKGHWRMSHN